MNQKGLTNDDMKFINFYNVASQPEEISLNVTIHYIIVSFIDFKDGYTHMIINK